MGVTVAHRGADSRLGVPGTPYELSSEVLIWKRGVDGTPYFLQ